MPIRWCAALAAVLAASLAQGTTVITNAAQEPEITDLANFLISMGARIQGAGSERITIEGVAKLNRPSHYHVMPDRIEAGTFLCAVAACGGNITLNNTDADSMDATIEKLRTAGVSIEVDGTKIHASMNTRPKAVGARTAPFPGFATDMQAQLMAVNCVADGTAVVNETIFENRFMHVQELVRLGANIEIEGHTAIIKGVERLDGATVMATDLRASAGLVIAGLAASDETRIDRIYHLDRGYDRMEEKLRKLGADVTRVAE